MKIATILPIPHLDLIDGDPYHMALAHLCGDKIYADFYRDQSDKGSFVLLDNGVVEKHPMPADQVLRHAERIHADEFILSDSIYNREETLTMGLAAMRVADHHGWGGKLMAVPQGDSPMEWMSCLRTMLDWDINSIGISRFVSKYFLDRVDALTQAPLLIGSDKEIHLLGCPGDPIEIAEVEKRFPGRVRGTDSGIAAIFTQEGKKMEEREGKPDVELNFGESLPVDLLRENVEYWRERACPQS